MAGPSSLTIHTLCGMASRASRRRASSSSRGNLGSTEVLPQARNLGGYSDPWLGVERLGIRPVSAALRLDLASGAAALATGPAPYGGPLAATPRHALGRNAPRISR